MGSALLHQEPLEPALPFATDDSARSHSPAEELRLQVAERLAAHRTRRDRKNPRLAARPGPDAVPAETRATRIAAAVAERYAQQQTYRAFLAAEGERAIQHARAAAEVAARNAQAVFDAQQQLLATLAEQAREEARQQAVPLTLWPEPTPVKLETPHAPPPAPSPVASAAPPSRAAAVGPVSGLTVRLSATTLPSATFHDGPHPRTQTAASRASTLPPGPEDDRETYALDAEIAFRQAPVFEEPAGPPMPLPANLLEFPRQLVAPRKARPRYAEGPLRDEEELAPGDAQLRIFEVETAAISTTPDPVDPAAQWSSIWLDAPPAVAQPSMQVPTEAAPAYDPASRIAPRPEPAPVRRRLKAAAIDAALVCLGFVASAATAITIAAHAAGPAPQDQAAPAPLVAAFSAQPGIALAAAGVSIAFLYVLYQALFFSFADATPGMRLTRIALCTLHDDNPTRRAMRRRVLAVLLTACPLGLLWIALDEDRLAWHDRLSRMYQRSY